MFFLIPALWAADLPLESLNYHVAVTGPLAEVVVEQVFRNDTSHFIEATYVFPLQPEAAVDEMRIEVGDRIIEGQILERRQAERVYDAAKTQGKVAALTTEERPNIFTQHVANIGPGETIRVTLGVIQPVPRKDGAYELVLPLVVAPRFVPEEDAATAAAVTPPLLSERAGAEEDGTRLLVDLAVDVQAGLSVVRAESPSHPVDLRINDRQLSASIQQVPADRDFVLRWWTATQTPRAAMLFSGEHGLLTIEPPQSSNYEDRVPRELIWVLDTSCSMSGNPLRMAKEAMQAALTQMQPNDSFVILSFGNTVDGVFAKPQLATSENVAAARSYVSNLKSDGGTRMVPALQAALRMPASTQRHRIISFLTDGQISNEDAILREIAAHPEIRFSSVGIGSAPNRYLLDEMARLGGGLSTYVSSAENPGKVLARMLETMDRPILTDIRIDWGQWKVESYYPSRIPDLMAGRPLLVAVHFRAIGEGPIRVIGRSGEGNFLQVIPPVRVNQERAMVTTWARQRVADVHRQFLSQKISDERTEILEVGLRWHLLTRYTAFVAVQKGRVNPDGTPVLEEQPLELPEGQEQPVGRSPMSADFVARIPTGRIYQDVVRQPPGTVGGSMDENTYLMEGVNITDPVTGTFGLNYNWDAAEPHPALDPPDTFGPSLLGIPGPFAWPTNRLTASSLLGATLSPNGEQYQFNGIVQGGLVKDHLWSSAAVGAETATENGTTVQTVPLAVRLDWEPQLQHRFFLGGNTDWATVDSPSSNRNGALGRLEYKFSSSSRWSLQSWVSGQSRRIDTGRWDGWEVGQTVQFRGQRFLGTHDLTASWMYDRLHWMGGTRAGHADLGTLVLGDDWFLKPVHLDLRLTGALLFDGEPHFLPSPGLTMGLDLGPKTTLSLGGLRQWNLQNLQIGAVNTDGLPSRTDRVTLGLQRSLPADLVFRLEGTFQDQQLLLVPDPGYIRIADVSNGTLDRQVWTATVGFQKTFAYRWSAGASYHLNFARLPDAALLDDPRSYWITELLDAYRRHRADGYLTWKLPLDPWTLSLSVLGNWASPIQEDVGWLGERTHITALASQKFPLRKNTLYLDLSVTWALHDPSVSLLPLPVFATETLDLPAPFQAKLALRWEF